MKNKVNSTIQSSLNVLMCAQHSLGSFFHVIFNSHLVLWDKNSGHGRGNILPQFPHQILSQISFCLIPIKVASYCTLKVVYRHVQSRHKGQLLPQALLICTLCSWSDNLWAEVTVSVPSAGFLQDKFWSTGRLFYASKTEIIQSSCGSQTGFIIWETC